MWHFRGLNLIQDAPIVQFYIAGTAVETADFGAATVYHPAHAGTQAIKLAIKNPSDLSSTDQGYADIGTSDEVPFAGTTDYTLVAAGTQANPRKLLVTSTRRNSVDDNKVNYQFVNAAVNAGPVDVEFTAPEAGISTAQSVGTLAVGAATTATDLDVPAASGASSDATRSVNFTITVRSGGTVFQSSSYNVAEKNPVLFVIADNFGPAGIKPVRVWAITGTAAGTATLLNDPSDGAEVRFANLSPDGGAMDDETVDSGVSTSIGSGITFGALSSYTPLANGSINSVTTAAGNSTAILFVNNFTANPARSYTLYAQGTLGSADLRGVPLLDDRRKVPTEARFRFFHAAPSQGGSSIDIYVRQAGAGLDLSASTPPTASVSALGYRAASTPLILKSGTYDVYFAQAGAKTTFLGPLPLTLSNGSVQTLALVDSPTSPLTLLPIDDAGP